LFDGGAVFNHLPDGGDLPGAWAFAGSGDAQKKTRCAFDERSVQLAFPRRRLPFGNQFAERGDEQFSFRHGHQWFLSRH
jgi:hypothetical protein